MGRIAVSQHELERTDVPPDTAWTMAVVLCVFIYGVPMTQAIWDYVLAPMMPFAAPVTAPPPEQAPREQMPGLQRDCVFRRMLQIPLEEAMTSLLGYGAERHVIGLDGWVFYRDGLTMLGGPGILDESRLAARRQALEDQGIRDRQADPRRAILELQEICNRSGVRLTVLPIPDKSMLSQGHLAGRLANVAGAPVPTNVDFPSFVAQLRAAGVDVFDPTPASIGTTDLFLRSDTHWTPQWMETVAGQLAEHLRQSKLLPPAPEKREWKLQQNSVTGTVVLEPGGNPGVLVQQTVSTNRVVDPVTSVPWQQSATADVLLLGDSFVGYYWSPMEGWGDAAGFAPHLSRLLGRDLTVVAGNALAAGDVMAEPGRRPELLRGKKLVIWEFSMLWLTSGSWPIFRAAARST